MSELTATPDKYDEGLTDSRLSAVGELMLDTLERAVAVTDTEDDCAYTRAVLAWGRIRNALKRLAKSKRFEWFGMPHDGNDLLIAIGGVTIRFFIDDHIKPRKQRVLSPTAAEANQLKFDYAKSDDAAPVLWRFIVERAISQDAEHRVFFVGYNHFGDIVAKWEFTQTIKTFRATDSEIPEPTDLGPVTLSAIYDEKVEAAANDDLGESGNG